MLNWIYNLTAKLRQKLSEKGQGMVEYALILAAVAVIAVVAFLGTNGAGGDGTLAGTIKKSFGTANTAIDDANSAVDGLKNSSNSGSTQQSGTNN